MLAACPCDFREHWPLAELARGGRRDHAGCAQLYRQTVALMLRKVAKGSTLLSPSVVTKLKRAVQLEFPRDGSPTEVAWELRYAMDAAVKEEPPPAPAPAKKEAAAGDDTEAKRKARALARQAGKEDKEIVKGTQLTVDGKHCVVTGFRRNMIGNNEFKLVRTTFFETGRFLSAISPRQQPVHGPVCLRTGVPTQSGRAGLWRGNARDGGYRRDDP